MALSRGTLAARSGRPMFGWPTQTTVRPGRESRSITAPTRAAYSSSERTWFASFAPTMKTTTSGS
jgi:hypothetical protein